ncbi:MAG: cell division protein ZapA [Chitinophagales bacterium]
MAEGVGNERFQRVRVTIAGEEYTLRTDEPVKHVEKLAARIDREMSELASRQPGVTRERLAVLVALGLASQVERLKEQAKAARKAAKAEVAAMAGPGGASASAPKPAAAPAEPAPPAAGSLFDSPGGEEAR